MENELGSRICEYFVGREEVVENLLICLLAGGHVLLEDVPGVGKTTLAKVLSGAVSCDFGRIQFTPDTLPTDVTGTEIYNMKTGEFEFRQGGIMHQILLADEINRTSPRTQASLLEAMAEGHVTVGGKRYDLPNPFMVIATQNPVEFTGTYSLPEAQMDRFMMKLSIGYPSRDEEIRMASNMLSGHQIESMESVSTAEDIVAMRGKVREVTISGSLLGYIRDIIDGTRQEERFVLGASPRAYLSMVSAAQGRAYLCGRDYVIPDDVKLTAYHVLCHRLVLTSRARIAGEDLHKIIDSIVLKVRIPH